MKYVTGLVVGKFCPLHRGHELVILQALKHCRKVVVLSYTSEDYENCTMKNRELWLKNFAEREGVVDRLSINVVYPWANLLDSSPEFAHRSFCAEYLLKMLETTVQAVFTSEVYGDGFARHLSEYFSLELNQEINVDHVLVDFSRTAVPVSGTMLREALKEEDYDLTDRFVSNYVSAFFAKKILFLGGESTGKSTIVKELAHRFHSDFVPEFGRELYDLRNGKLMYEDFEYIAKTQLQREHDVATNFGTTSFLFCDTSPLTTAFYSQEWMGRISVGLEKMVNESFTRYEKVYICAPDFPMVQDGTRQDETFRMKGHKFFIDTLTSEGTPFTILTGSLEERVEKVTQDLMADYRLEI